MRHLLCFSALLIGISPVFSQTYQLVHHNTIPGLTSRVQKHADSSGFEVVHVLQGGLPESINIGIWEEHLIAAESIAGTIFSTILYTEDFQVGNTLFYDRGGNTPLGRHRGDRVLMNINAQPEYPTNNPILNIVPPISSYPNSEFGHHVFMDFDPIQQDLNGFLDVTYDFNPFLANYEPYFGFHDATRSATTNNLATVLQDSIMVAYVRLFGPQTVNGMNTYEPFGEQINLLRLETNLNTYETIAQPIGSASGSHRPLHVSSPSPSSSELLRIGIVRGEDTPISVTGAIVEMEPGDSLYHVYMIRENATGETEWLTELYAYNNTFPDTTTIFAPNNRLRARSIISSILSKNGSYFIGSRFTAAAHPDDTLFFRDFTGEHFSAGNQSPGNSENYKSVMKEIRIYQVNSVGNISRMLSTKYKHPHPGDILGQANHLFDLGEYMVWLIPYRAVNDTVATITHTHEDGSQEFEGIELPGGGGIALVWLNENLEIIGHNVMSCFGNQMASIQSILPFRGDTILIQGNIGLGTTVDLAMFSDDESELLTSAPDHWSAFFAFYSGQGPVGTKNPENPDDFKLYPNPAREYITVAGHLMKKGKYTIHDLTGRAVKRGILEPDQRIDVSAFGKGVYLLSLQSEFGLMTKRFVVL